jgi:glucosamine kinase
MVSSVNQTHTDIMILVADSGSTKCDWLYKDAKGALKELHCIGLNPTFHNSAFITIQAKKAFKGVDTDLFTRIFYYGAGCNNEDKMGIVRTGLQVIFPNAEIYVSHDIEASAIATCGNKEGIACILGTGSNMCYWNGKKIIQQIPVFGMGYILGDEGSGAYMGKLLLKSYFYNEMPINLSVQLKSSGITKSVVEENVYNKSGANVYLASFTRFIYENRNHKFIQGIIGKAFRDFFDTHIVFHKKHRLVPVNFVGSIAFLFQEELKQIASKEYKVKVNTIIKQPIENLLQYHLRPYHVSQSGRQNMKSPNQG